MEVFFYTLQGLKGSWWDGPRVGHLLLPGKISQEYLFSLQKHVALPGFQKSEIYGKKQIPGDFHIFPRWSYREQTMKRKKQTNFKKPQSPSTWHLTTKDSDPQARQALLAAPACCLERAPRLRCREWTFVWGGWSQGSGETGWARVPRIEQWRERAAQSEPQRSTGHAPLTFRRVLINEFMWNNTRGQG